ncbi:MAG: hypothetical protein JST75_21970 [Bacteroidetes bacterium]|nr:hypothetical protein [Bacteroidota bacterium]
MCTTLNTGANTNCTCKLAHLCKRRKQMEFMAANAQTTTGKQAAENILPHPSTSNSGFPISTAGRI